MNNILLSGLFIALSVVAFAAGKTLNRRLRHPAANATLIAIALVIVALLVSGQSYATYLHGGGLIAWLLGPATVALGIPLARHRKAIARDAKAVGIAVLVGAAISAIFTPFLMRVLGGSSLLALSIAPKSVTTPIAMAIAERTGGVPALAAVFAIIGGVIVAVLADPILRRLGIQDHRTFGITAGVAGSGIGAAQAVDRHPQAGAYAALAVGLNSILTAVLVPVFIDLHWV
jgi:putative effector of murein hydrolase